MKESVARGEGAREWTAILKSKRHVMTARDGIQSTAGEASVFLMGRRQEKKRVGTQEWIWKFRELALVLTLGQRSRSHLSE